MSKAEIITFKVDGELADALSHIDNRSAFIRKAILDALGNSCPLCGGNGILTVPQRNHWREFTEHHRVIECSDCHEAHLICEHETVG